MRVLLPAQKPWIGGFQEVKWRTKFRGIAKKVADAAFIIKSSAGLQPSVIILHGASCSGKSFTLRRLRRKYADCTYVEMDELGYWNADVDPNILNIALNLLTDAGVKQDESRALIVSIEQTGREPERNYSPYKVMVKLLKTSIKNHAVIATCGNLPPPHKDHDFYRLLAQCTGKSILHVLVAPDNMVFAKRVKSRGQEALMEQHIARNSWRLQNRESYHVTITGNESTVEILELIRASIRSISASSCVDASAKKRMRGAFDGCTKSGPTDNDVRQS